MRRDIKPVGETACQLETLDDLTVGFRAAGVRGPARVVCIHGLAQDHRMWTHLQNELVERQTFAYDVRGHGATTLGRADGTLAQLGRDLIAFLEAHGAGTCVGFSLGGTVALWAAAERPDLVTSVIAIATSSVVGRTAAAGLERRIALFETGDDAAVREVVRADTEMQLAEPNPQRVDAIERSRLEAIGDRAGYLNGARTMLGMHAEPLNARLERITVPVHLIGAEGDRVCPRRAAEIMLEHLPGATFEELPGIGHLVTDENPDAVTAAVRKRMTDHQEVG
jgi:pimeloyl-ACP methyl ester carboxylesterase